MQWLGPLDELISELADCPQRPLAKFRCTTRERSELYGIPREVHEEGLEPSKRRWRNLQAVRDLARQRRGTMMEMRRGRCLRECA